MKKLVAVAAVLVLSCVGCGDTQLPPVSYAQIAKSAKCINQGVQCSMYAYEVFTAENEEDALVAWPKFAGCVDTLFEIGCPQQGAEFAQMIKDAKKEKENE